MASTTDRTSPESADGSVELAEVIGICGYEDCRCGGELAASEHFRVVEERPLKRPS